MPFTRPVLTVGWVVALIVGIITCIFWGIGLISKEQALLIIAVCAVSL